MNSSLPARMIALAILLAPITVSPQAHPDTLAIKSLSSVIGPCPGTKDAAEYFPGSGFVGFRIKWYVELLQRLDEPPLSCFKGSSSDQWFI